MSSAAGYGKNPGELGVGVETTIDFRPDREGLEGLPNLIPCTVTVPCPGMAHPITL